MARQIKTVPHPCNSRNDARIAKLRRTYKTAGYGVYYMILEMLVENDSIGMVSDYAAIAYELRENVAMIKSIINDFGLFSFSEDGGFFYSEDLKKSMQLHQVRSLAGRKGLEVRWNNKQSTDSKTYSKSDSKSDSKTYSKSDSKTYSKSDSKMIEKKEEIERTKDKEEKEKEEKKKLPKGSKEKEERNDDNDPDAETKVSATPLTKEVALLKRQESFYQQLVPFVEKYGRAMVRDFYDYWSEPNRSKTKMLCETKPTWDLPRRLATWKRKEDEKQDGRKFKTAADRKAEVNRSALSNFEEELRRATLSQSGQDEIPRPFEVDGDVWPQ